MKRITFQSRKRGPKKSKDEKAVEFGALRLPKELLEDLKIYRSAYEDVKAPKDENGFPLPMKVSFEQMISRWMNNVGRFDKDVQEEFLRRKELLQKHQIEVPFPVDPTDGNIWEMRYEVYDDNQLCVPASIEKDGHFWADFDGLKVPLENVLSHEGWTFVNEAGVTIEKEDIARVEQKICKHIGIQETKKGQKMQVSSWFVHADGRHYEVKTGRYGKEDFAIDALPGYHYASQTQMLAARFIRVEIPIQLTP